MEDYNSMDCEINNVFCKIRIILSNFESVASYEQLKTELEELTDIFKRKTQRQEVDDGHVETLGEVFLHCTDRLKDSGEEDQTSILHCTTECLRVLRNVCADCRTNQERLGRCEACVSCCETVIGSVTSGCDDGQGISEDKTVLLRCCVQFLGNLVAGHQTNAALVWEHFAGRFRHLLHVDDHKLTQYVCMVVHSCVQAGQQDKVWLAQLTTQTHFSQIVCDVLHMLISTDLDWGIYIIEDALRLNNILENIDPLLSEKERILVLEVLLTMLRCIRDPCDTAEERALCPCVPNIMYISTQVVSSAYNILILAGQDTDSNDPQPEVIVKQIEVLGEASSCHSVYGDLRENANLLTTSVYLLEAIHKLGKDGNNPFSCIVKLSDTEDVDTNHPVYGLRRDLVRLIGNLCFRHRPNQDRARELNAIPLILDQSNIDKKNPYITQWAILAIRNLCEDCPGNKEVLAGLKQQGLADNTTVLRELGVDAEVQGDKIVVRPSEQDRKDQS